MIEIERKFLVTDTVFKTQAFNNTRISQGYLNSHPERSVRIRIRDNNGFLTIKGKSNASGTSRFEWEKEIDYDEATELLKLCEEGSIEKTRYEIRSGTHVIEVDEFYGKNEGLIVAEIELSDENEVFIKPDWLGREVTGDIKYYNSNLLKKPYLNW